jgi:hypothetical protein
MDWMLLDDGPPEAMGTQGYTGHYEKPSFRTAEDAAKAAQQMANERGRIIRVIGTFWPVKPESHSN